MANRQRTITGVLMALALAFVSGVRAQEHVQQDVGAFQNGQFSRRI